MYALVTSLMVGAGISYVGLVRIWGNTPKVQGTVEIPNQSR